MENNEKSEYKPVRPVREPDHNKLHILVQSAIQDRASISVEFEVGSGSTYFWHAVAAHHPELSFLMVLPVPAMEKNYNSLPKPLKNLVVTNKYRVKETPPSMTAHSVIILHDGLYWHMRFPKLGPLSLEE